MKRLVSAKRISSVDDDFDTRWNDKFGKYYDPNATTVTMTYEDYVKFIDEVREFE